MFGTLCYLRVLCVSVVNRSVESISHRDTEVTEVAQRNFSLPYRSSRREHGVLLRMSVAVLLCFGSYSALSQTRSTIKARAVSAPLTITTEPNAIIWIDEIRRGVTDASGRLELKKISAGRHTLRVRAMGFKEATTPLVAGRRSVAVKLIKTTDQAELLFQQAEDAREKAKDDATRQKAADLYREVFETPSGFPRGACWPRAGPA